MITEPTPRTKDYVKWSREAANAVGVGRKTMIAATLILLWKEMTPQEREYVNKTWRDPR